MERRVFTLTPHQKCSKPGCDAVSVAKIIGHPGNVPWGAVCARHKKSWLAELTRANNDAAPRREKGEG